MQIEEEEKIQFQHVFIPIFVLLSTAQHNLSYSGSSSHIPLASKYPPVRVKVICDFIQ